MKVYKIFIIRGGTTTPPLVSIVHGLKNRKFSYLSVKIYKNSIKSKVRLDVPPPHDKIDLKVRLIFLEEVCMDITLRVRKVKRGETSKGFPYLMIGFGDRCNGFVSADDMDSFADVRRGDYVECEMLGFPEDGGIKLFPRAIVDIQS